MLQLSTKTVSEFICTADKCPDTCCKHWSMQVEAQTVTKYRENYPELLDAVEQDVDGTFIMRKDTQTSYCVKFDNGRCGIQNKYGEALLGDACSLYPRITRNVGDKAVVTATMSCPEIASIALYSEKPFTIEENFFARLPQEIKNILPDVMTAEDAISLHNLFIAATEDESASVEKIFARVNSVSSSLQRVEKKDWVRAGALYFRLADSSIPKAESNINDPFNLLHSLCGLIVASKKTMPPRLEQTVADMEKALRVKLDWQNALIATSDESLAAYGKLHKLWLGEMQEKFQPLLRRWLAAQLSASLYPFAGLGDDLRRRATIIGVRLAIVRLALMSAYSLGNKLEKDDIIRIMQSLSRFLDHLASAKFSMQIYEETGWNKEARMIGLLS